MTIEARAKFLKIIPAGGFELTFYDGEFTLVHSGSNSEQPNISVLRAATEHELIRIPYIPSDESDVLARGEQEILTRGEINRKNLKGKILERDFGEVTIHWKP